jgi:hypothetical protein
VTNSVEVEVGESHRGGVLPGSYIYIRDLRASLISERERDLLVLRRYWLEENIPV